MKLLTKEILRTLPPLYSQENVADPLVRVKFFYPVGSATWGAIEYDGKDIFFGWASLQPGMGELGYFSLRELQSVRGPMGLGIERDMHFTPVPLSRFNQSYPNVLRRKKVRKPRGFRIVPPAAHPGQSPMLSERLIAGTNPALQSWVWIRIGDQSDYEKEDDPYSAGYRLGVYFEGQKMPRIREYGSYGVEAGEWLVGPYNYVSLFWGGHDAQPVRGLTKAELEEFKRGVDEARR